MIGPIGEAKGKPKVATTAATAKSDAKPVMKVEPQPAGATNSANHNSEVLSQGRQ